MKFAFGMMKYNESLKCYIKLLLMRCNML